ncbi:nucleotidyltransferase [Staphylococcus saprophyticus]|uniref:nucleotidyltransferase domain-containing protein n=1 Tax=Staphylococcus TaxID=1279 RepID=UPI001865A5F7|nr:MULTISPECIES: nucleotidyltransferase [Staphylococcus]MDW4005854.1 nucleotidyltransferase [Staphylococcus saprophyticus]MDW4495871.1 nucleotidyltransferase [Staphylococcus saprophyticus]
MHFTEEQLKHYAKPLSDTEKNMCKNVIKMVRESLQTLGFEAEGDIDVLNEDTFSYRIKMKKSSASYKINIFVKGSYANNTNVRQNSDVDIAIVREDVFYTQFRKGVNRENYNFTQANESPFAYKDEVEKALKQKFDSADIQRGNKAIRINGNTYRKEADCVPCLRYRDYRKDFSFNTENYVGGIKIFSDKGEEIINYPEQHIDNGVIKNKNTNYNYKKMVRIIKEMRHQLIEQGNKNAKNTSSFGVEGLIWNIPDFYFIKYSSFGFIFEELINYLEMKLSDINYFKEANGILNLCNTPEKIKIYQQFVRDLGNHFNYKYGASNGA